MTDPKAPIALSDLIQTVRAELRKAEDEGREDDLRFAVEGVEIELAVTIARDEKVDGKFDLKVFSFGGELSDQTGSEHRIKIVMRPRRRGGEDVEITSAGTRPSGVPEQKPMRG